MTKMHVLVVRLLVLQLIVHSAVHLLDSMEKVHDVFCLLFLALLVARHYTKGMHNNI